MTRASAEVRVFPPVPLDGWPRDLARLQVSGTDLDDPRAAARAADPARPALWLNPEPGDDRGQGDGPGRPRRPARPVPPSTTATARPVAGRRLPARGPDRGRTALGRAAGRDLPVVHDAGFTEVAPGTCTAVAEILRA